MGRARAWAWACACACLCASLPGACASQPRGPFFGDERLLLVGVEPDEEAQDVAAALVQQGYAQRVKLRGRGFHALGHDHRDGGPGLVRVITARGIMLALDPLPADSLQPGRRYELLVPAREGVYDADGDGFDDLFVRVYSYDESAVCLRVYHVLNSGFVDAVAETQAAAIAKATPYSKVPTCPDEPGREVDAGSSAEP